MRTFFIGSLVLLALALSSPAGETLEWADITFDFNAGESSCVVGPGRTLSSVRPTEGKWQVTLDLRNHFAGLAGASIPVFSANRVRFGNYNAACGHAGRGSQITFKLRLSEPVTGLAWRVPGLGKNLSPGGKLAARYSLNGKTWKDAFRYSAGTQPESPTVNLKFSQPTRMLYFGWYGDCPEGQNVFWNAGDIGTFTLISANPSPVQAAPTASAGLVQGPRFVPNSFFGTVTHVNSEGTMPLLKDLNASTVILNFRWQALEFGRGDYAFSEKRNFGKGNFVIDSADLGIKHGLDQVPMLDMAPNWALNPDGTYPNDASAAALEECAYQVATKYKGKIKYWMAANEPNMAVWKDRFIVFMKAFYKGIKRADPTNKVVLCGFAGVESQHLDAVYRLGGKDYFDILGSHSYTRPRAPESGFLELIRANYDVMKKYGDNKPLWVTEMGWNGVEPAMLEYCRAKWADHRAYDCTEEEQARYLARAFLLASSVPWIERFYWFHLHQENPYNEAKEGADGYMGLFSPWLNGQIRPKDAYFAVKTVIGVLNESDYTGAIDLGSRTWALVYERENEATVAIWSLDDDITFQLSDSSMVTGVTSMVGTPILVVDNKLPISGRPIYVKTDLAHCDALKDQIRTAKIEGQKAYDLGIGLDLTKTTGAKPVVGVHLTNVTPREQILPDVFVQATPPWQMDTVKITDGKPFKAGEERVFSLPLKGPVGQGGEVVAEVQAHFFSDTTFNRVRKTIRYVTAARRPEAFRADGNLDEWKNHTPIQIGQVPQQRDFPDWKGPADCSGRWYCAWDETNLYFAAEINDDVHHQPADRATSDDQWRADGIQIGIDVGGDAKPSSNVPQYDGVNDIELGIALGKDKPLAYFWVNPKLGQCPADLNQLAIRRDETSHRTRYEAAIPWSKLGLATSPKGKWMGINVLVNDSDGQGREGWLQWSQGLGEMKDPSFFPKVLFD